MRTLAPLRPACTLLHATALALAATLAGCATAGPARPERPAGEAARPGARTAAILAINDVYRIEGVEGGTLGGLARVRTLREELERRHPDLLLLHGGDLLFPSFLSRTYNGAQMIDMLNWLDGDPAAMDERMFVVFGNHEFDKADAGLIDRRVEGSQFRWTVANLAFSQDGATVAAANLDRSYLVEAGGIKLGLFGLIVNLENKPPFVTGIADPIVTARTLTADLRARGAEVVVALTHLNWVTDKRLLEELGDAGPDLIIGGHDHEHMEIPVGRRMVLKADADARTATVALVTLHPDGRVEVANELRALADSATPPVRPDPRVAAEVQEWLACHERQFCADAGSPHGCLDEVLGRTRTRLVAEESHIRSEETSLGDWVADQMLAAYASCGAQAAFVNSGSLRLNQDLPAGSEVTRQHVEELFGFPAPLRLLEVDGATLQKVADRAVQQWPGSGNWLQGAGMSFVHDSKAGTASDLTLLNPQPHRVTPDETVRVVTNDYVAGGGDGYTMLKGVEQVADCAVGTPDLKLLVQQALRDAEPTGIAPVENDGRVCPAPAVEGCRALRP
jgi:2',3'-cyclic-nucleotide 2'-phosphodiesterase (5'-nucleotidase family)